MNNEECDFKYANVIVPLALEGVLTYIIPSSLRSSLQIGMRVIVNVGKQKQYTGIVVHLFNNAPETGYTLKPILEQIDKKPLILPHQLRLWNFLSTYYLCTLGEVMKAALPSSLKLESESYISKGEAVERTALEPLELEILAKFKQKEHLPIKRLESAFKGKKLTGIIHRMIANGLLEVSERVQTYYQNPAILTPSSNTEEETAILSPLNAFQSQALEDIKTAFLAQNVCLLHGVTSSGKTQIYCKLIEETLNQGKQVLFLVPEIALTTQLTLRLQKVFKTKMGVYHSRFSDKKRVEIWQKQTSNSPYGLILGVRSSLFLPYQNLGLIIVDEEHEASYKQNDPAPRYHARDTAIILAQHLQAKVLLGTATPSIESYYNAQNGKYGLVTLTQRFGEISLPDIHTINISKRENPMPTPLSPLLIEAIQKALGNNEQIILFINRRGYAPFITCQHCGWVPRCNRCDVSLTYHNHSQKLICHYCGAVFQKPKQCACCEREDLRDIGQGTEKIEETVQKLFSNAQIARMDLDTTRSAKAYEKIISNFQQQKTQILIGTQMVTKGLDFDGVTIVGILNADVQINMADFRAHEKSFQMFVQVSGRAGRRSTPGMVYLQTRQPQLPLLAQIATNNYTDLFNQQLLERKLFLYPPFCRLIYIYLKHKDEDTTQHASLWLGGYLRHFIGSALLGPEKPFIGRIQGMHIRKMIVKIPTTQSLTKTKGLLLTAKQALENIPIYKSVRVYFDVDPV